MKKYNVGIIGSQGAVGTTIKEVLAELDFPINNIRFFDIVDIGKNENWGGSEVEVEESSIENVENLDLVFVAVSDAVSLKMSPEIAKKGITVIDNSSAFRLHVDVPLVIPEINSDDLRQNKGIVANPNCVTTIGLLALGALNQVVKIQRIIASTYQAVSGAGIPGIHELAEQTKAKIKHEPISNEVFEHPIAFNLIPHIDAFQENGYSKEEMKFVYESRKILHSPDLKVNCTCVRVPILRSHCESLTVEFDSMMDAQTAREILKKTPGIVVIDDPDESKYPMPIDAANKNEVFVGRIRDDISCENSVSMWVCGDQIRKGAATNAVQIGLKMIEMDLIS